MALADWRPVCIHGYGQQSHLARDWYCDPAWDLHAVYAAADAELPPPAGVGERRVWVFRDRHIDRRFHLEYPRSTATGPRTRSRTIDDAAREWQLVIEHRDRYLAEAGLTLASSEGELAKCLADTFRCDSYFAYKPQCPTFPEGPRELSNPIEGLLFQSFCVGCAHAYAALADACGLAVRTIGCGAHRIAEVRIDGHWRMVENSCRHPGSEALAALFPASFMVVTQQPTDFSDQMPAAKAAGYWGMPNGQYHFMGGTWQCPKTLRFGAANAHALYPEADHWQIKSGDGRHLPIFERAGGFYWEDGVHSSDRRPAAQRRPFPVGDEPLMGDFLYAPLGSGERLRQSVWLDAIDDLIGLELTLPLAPQPGLVFDEQLGRALRIRSGALDESLVELGAWPPQPATNRGHQHVCVALPSAVLRADAVNWIELVNDSEHELLCPFIPAAMEPYIPPLWARCG